MRLTGSRAYATPPPTPTMPPGLVDLMEGLAKDVLKNSPENVYEFCAGHMQKLLEIRDGPLPTRKQLTLEEKVAKAQEKIRRRLKNKQLQHGKNISQQSNENHEQENEQLVKQHDNNISQKSSEDREHENEEPVKETPVLNLESVIQPVVHGEELVNAKEVEIFHEPDGTVATNDSLKEVSQVEHKVEENIEVAMQTIEPEITVENGTAVAMQTMELEKSTEKDPAVAMQTIEPETTVEKDTAVAMQTIELEKSTETDPAVAMQTIELEKSAEKDPAVAMQTIELEKSAEKDTAVAMRTIELEKSAEQDITVAVQTIEPETTVENDTAVAMQTIELEKSTEKDPAVAMQTIELEKSTEKDPAVAMQTKEREKSAEKDTAVDMQTIELKQLAEKDPAVAMQTIELEKSTEKINGEVKGDVSDNTKPTSNLEPIFETGNVAIVHQDLQNKYTEFTEPTKSVVQNTENVKVQLEEAEPIVGKNYNDAEDKTVTLQVNESLEKTEINKEVNEVASTQLLGNHSVVSKTDDTIQTKDIIEEEKITKEKDSIKIYDSKIEENSKNLLPKTVETSPGDSSDDQHAPENLQETIIPLNATQTEHSTNIEAPDTSNPEAVNDIELLEDQVITVEITEKAVDDSHKNKDDKHSQYHNYETVHENELDSIPRVDKQLIDADDKLPEQERANSRELSVEENDIIQDDTKLVNANNTIIESEETTENTAVSGMDLETAAITIQKVFRTFLFSKSRASTLEDSVMGNSLEEDVEKKDESEYVLTSTNLSKERRALGISRMDTVLQTVNEEKSFSLSDDSSLSSAATTIQAQVRGFLVRNRLASNKTASSSSLVNSDGPSTISLDGDTNEPKKTVLNIHIVPERGQFMSRDESLLTSIDLPLDNSPQSSINLHPLGYDKSERRKQLKREDAIQSISPPSNSSGKLSEEVDSVNAAANGSVDLKEEHENISMNGHDKPTDPDTESCDTTLTISSTAETVIDADAYHARDILSSPEHNLEADNKMHDTAINSSSDEMDVVTPFPTITGKQDKVDNENNEKPKLLHSGEFHDIVVQTQVNRSEPSVVREFKNVLVYFLLWDKT